MVRAVALPGKSGKRSRKAGRAPSERHSEKGEQTENAPPGGRVPSHGAKLCLYYALPPIATATTVPIESFFTQNKGVTAACLRLFAGNARHILTDLEVDQGSRGSRKVSH